MKQTATTTAARTPDRSIQAEPVTLHKRIGSTTFKVKVRFSTTSKETMTDKIMRLIKQEVA